jgi:MFS transporter, DHA2 family, multidrug resistance protein
MTAGAVEVKHRGLLALVMMAATIMHALDATIANVALPHMQGTLSATHDQISWVLTSYIVASAIMTPLTGFLAGRFGRRLVFFWAVVGFTLASMLCGAAMTLDQIVLFRALQGAFGAALVPLSQSTLLDIYPPQQHSSVMGLWGVGVMVGPIMGPTLGGWLTEEFTWRWVFYINVPVGILACLGIAALMPAEEKLRRPFDFTGFALLGISIACMQLVLDRGELLDWFTSTEIIIETVVAGVCLVMFVIHVMTTDHPFFDLRLFEDPNFSISLLFTATTGMALIASAALMPPFLAYLGGYPAITIGLVMAPRGIGMMFSMLVVGRLARRYDPRIIMGLGLLISAGSLWVMTGFTMDIHTWDVIWTGVGQGFGLGFVFVPISVIMFATMAPALRTEAAAINALLRNLGGSLGIAILVAMVSQNIQMNRSELAGHISPFNPNLTFAPSGVSTLAMWDAELTKQATLIAYLNDFRAMAWFMVATLPLLFLLRRPPAMPAVRA